MNVSKVVVGAHFRGDLQGYDPVAQSGLGRELGPEASDAFTDEKSAFIASDREREIDG